MDNPCDDVQRFPERNQERVAPTLEEIQAVLKVLRDGSIRSEGLKAADFVEFLSLSGCRLAEAGEIVWERVFFEHGYILVRGKSDQDRNYKERKIPLFPGLRQLLERLYSECLNPAGLIFPGNNGQAYVPKRALDAAIKTEGLPPERRFTFHGLRHAFATEAVVCGVMFPAVAAWLGHSDNGVLVAARYGNHVTDDQVAHYIARMNLTKPMAKQCESDQADLLAPLLHSADPMQTLCVTITKEHHGPGVETSIQSIKGRELSRRTQNGLTAFYYEMSG